MKRGVVLLSVVSLLLGGWGASSAATIRSYSLDLNVLGGYNNEDKDAKLDNAWFQGAQLGLSIRHSLMVEGSVETGGTKSHHPGYTGSTFDERLYGLRLLGTFKGAEDTKVKPYVLAGVGYDRIEFRPNNGRPDVHERTAYQEIGLGAHVFLWKNLNLRPEIRLRHYRALEVTHDDTLFTLGLSYLFFGEKK